MKNRALRAFTAALAAAFALNAGSIAAFAEGAAAEAASDEENADSDQAAADAVAGLIDAIYTQERTETTDEDCTAAKEAWDALTDVQKELVEGENASPDYFGLDTGDASADDPLNADGIGENELLVVSFGTSYNDSRVQDIKGIEDALAEAFPEWSVRRAFTSQIIINHIQARDGETIDNMRQALERAAANGVKNLVVQPTHLMRGSEYDEMAAAVSEYADQFESVAIGEPMLGEVGNDATVINEDKKAVCEAVVDAAVSDAGYGSMEAAEEDGAAFVFLGHGTSHTAKVSYSQMQTQMGELGYDNAFIGTVEGEPEETACEAVIGAVQAAGYTKVILRPLMVVAGDHAYNDMAGSGEDSWLSMFETAGCFERVETQISGLGSIGAVQELYAAHAQAAVDSLEAAAGKPAADGETADAVLEDGVYSALFETDSSMFHVNEALEGRGTLTVEDGRMTIHVTLVSKSIVNLFPGTAADAQKDGASLLEPTEDSVTYSDGYQETVYGFDIPVPALDEEFDVALIGKKGKWYDHKVSVSDPRPLEETAEEALKLEDGSYTVEASIEGGSGKASVESPAALAVKDGKAEVTLVWSSPYYDYMKVGEEKYEPVNTEGNSVFVIPVSGFDQDIPVTADTIAMSTPHEIEYTLRLDSGTIKEAEE